MLNTFRPGHADYTYLHKYGLRDPRGGGPGLGAADRADGRRRRGRAQVAALKVRHSFVGHMTQIGEIEIPFESLEHIRTTRSSLPTRATSPASRPTWTSCARPATVAVRAST
jgi:chorismate synthase